MFRRKKGRDLLWKNELLVIDTVADSLSEKSRAIVNQQLGHIVFVQRIVRKEVNLYYTRGHRNVNPEVPLLRTSSCEQHIATVTLRNQSTTELNKCKIWLVKSCLFTIEFDLVPKKKDPIMSVDRIQILHDPSVENMITDPPEMT